MWHVMQLEIENQALYDDFFRDTLGLVFWGGYRGNCQNTYFDILPALQTTVSPTTRAVSSYANGSNNPDNGCTHCERDHILLEHDAGDGIHTSPPFPSTSSTLQLYMSQAPPSR